MRRVLDGFLPFSRATIMFDVVVLAMVLFLPVMAWSVSLAKRGRYELHKRVQTALTIVLALTIALFEIDVQTAKRRYEGGWRALTVESPYHGGPLDRLLRVHLAFAVAAAVLWTIAFAQARLNFGTPPSPGPYSRNHRILAWAAAVGLTATCTTGGAFYYMAFVAAS